MRFVEIYPFPWTAPPTPPDCAQDLGCVCTQEVLWQECKAIKRTDRVDEGGGWNAGETTAIARETETCPQHTGHTALYTSTNQWRARGSSMFPDLPLLVRSHSGWLDCLVLRTEGEEKDNGRGRCLNAGKHFSLGLASSNGKVMLPCKTQLCNKDNLNILSQIIYIMNPFQKLIWSPKWK